MRSKAMAECMATAMLEDSCVANCLFYSLLDGILRQMMPSLSTAARINRTIGRGEHILPAPLLRRIRIFASQRVRQKHFTVTGGDIFGMQQLHFLQMTHQWLLQL